jgi:hypothetical protein
MSFYIGDVHGTTLRWNRNGTGGKALDRQLEKEVDRLQKLEGISKVKPGEFRYYSEF